MKGDYDAKLVDWEEGEDGSTIFVLECQSHQSESGREDPPMNLRLRLHQDTLLRFSRLSLLGLKESIMERIDVVLSDLGDEPVKKEKP